MAAEKTKKRQLRPDTTKKSEEEPKQVAKSKPVRSGAKNGLTPIRSMFMVILWPLRRIVPRYFKNSFKELRLVTWPNWKETRQLTTAVILFAIVLGAAVTAVDYGLGKIFKKVILKQ